MYPQILFIALDYTEVAAVALFNCFDCIMGGQHVTERKMAAGGAEDFEDF